MNDPSLSVITLHSEVTRLCAALDDVAHAHERDLMRVARALGFDHEPPSDVDAIVAAAERDHELADMVGANQAMAARETGRAVLLEDERDAAIAEVGRLRTELAAERTEHAAHEGTLRLERDALRAVLDGRTTPPTDAEIHEHASRGGAWLVTLPAVKQVRSKPETRYTDDPREVSRLWWSEGARWVAVLAGRPTAWPVVTP